MGRLTLLQHFILTLVTMKTAFALSLPALFLSQLGSASPAWRDSANSVPALEQRSDCHGAVASESSICSDIGINTLKSGGNAADALVSTVLCIGVVGMYHSGIGGGGFSKCIEKSFVVLIMIMIVLCCGQRQTLESKALTNPKCCSDLVMAHLKISTSEKLPQQPLLKICITIIR